MWDWTPGRAALGVDSLHLHNTARETGVAGAVAVTVPTAWLHDRTKAVTLYEQAARLRRGVREIKGA